jgi:hypothetical protein
VVGRSALHGSCPVERFVVELPLLSRAPDLGAPARKNEPFALWGIVLASLNVLVLGMLSYVLVPISLCLGVAGVVRAGRVGVMMELSVVTIILSLVGFAGGVFWYVHPPHFP